MSYWMPTDDSFNFRKLEIYGLIRNVISKSQTAECLYLENGVINTIRKSKSNGI
jgi:hypothetical protein